MVYKGLLIDVFNLTHKMKSVGSNSTQESQIELANKIIDFIEVGYLSRIQDEGCKTYLLFDPIVDTDLAFEKAYKKTLRQSTLVTYKANRTHDSAIQNVVNMLYRYYLSKNKKDMYICMSESLEADDFVESIVKEFKPEDKLALITTDLDWSRYLTSTVRMITSLTGEEILTDVLFEEKYGFYPTIASVTLEKAFFGDKSDNIKGALSFKTNKNTKNLIPIIREYLCRVANSRVSLKEVLATIKGYSFKDLAEKENKTDDEALWLQLLSSNKNTVSISSHFFHNVNVLSCKCKDYKEFMIQSKDNSRLRKMIEEVLGRGESKPKKFKFGIK